MQDNRRFSTRDLLLVMLTLSMAFALIRLGFHVDTPFSWLFGIAGLTLFGGVVGFVFGFVVGGKVSARQAAFFAVFWLVIIFMGLGLSALLDLVF